MSNELQLSNASYTNKSFSEAYPELLELARQLSYKWDPTISNESDPGVVLIKEMALLIDKNNYNSDKNVLETMPLSVTQDRIARKLFQLLGYYPRWYKSSKVQLSLSWNSNQTEIPEITPDADTYIKLANFIQICDDDAEYVYTIINQDINIPTNGTAVKAEAIEGRINDLFVNGFDVITIDLIDDQNRVYLPDYYVAENGIFVFATTNIGEENNTSIQLWNQVKNLSTESLKQRIYSFGIDQTSGSCYIEFPDDITQLIGSGLRIKYITSQGQNGNVSPGTLNKLFSTGTGSCNGQIINLSSDNLIINNTGLIYAGEDPENIDEMYRNYKHTVGTFDTLVTTRDYSNAFYNVEAGCSNDFVCDRTDDIQDAYRILTESENGNDHYLYRLHDMVDANSQKVPFRGLIDQANNSDVIQKTLMPFDLKVYAFQFDDYLTNDRELNTLSDAELDAFYQKTFWFFDSLEANDDILEHEYIKLINSVQNNKCIQHNYQDLEPNRIAVIKNKYSVDCRIIPISSMTDIQVNEIKLNIKRAIYENFNSRKMDFSEKITYEELQRVVLNSDPRIKSVFLGEMTYHTYLMYYALDEYWTDTGEEKNG